MNNLRKGDTAYMLVNNHEVTQVTVMDCFGGLHTIRLPDGGVSKVKSHRLFATPREAEESRQRRNRPSFRMSGTMYT